MVVSLTIVIGGAVTSQKKWSPRRLRHGGAFSVPLQRERKCMFIPVLYVDCLDFVLSFSYALMTSQLCTAAVLGMVVGRSAV